MKAAREILRALTVVLTLLVSVQAPALDTAATGVDEGPVHSAIVNRVSGAREWDRIEVVDVRVQGGVQVSEGAAFDVVGESAAKPLGRRDFQLKDRNDRTGRTIQASALVRAYNTVYYLTRPMGRGDRIKSDDLVAGEMDVTRIPQDAVKDPAELEGWVASRTLQANTLLCQSQLRRAPVARRGDRVILTAGSGAIQAVVPGVLREDGHLGSVVRVTNLMSGKEISGWLVDAGTVKVGF